MSVLATSHVWRYSEHGGSALLVLLALADQSDDAGWCFPGVPYLAKKCRLSERAIRDNLARLEESGDLERHPRPGRSNYYRLNLEPPSTPVHKPVGDPTPAESAPLRPAADTPAADRKGPCGAPQVEPSLTRHDPLAGAPDADGAGLLPGMPEAPEPWNAGLIVAAWCKGYADAHDGAAPLPALLNRVRGSAKHAAKDAPEHDRDALLAVAAAAGRLARFDVVAACADAAAGRLPVTPIAGAGTLSPSSRNAAILARAAERLGDESEGPR